MSATTEASMRLSVRSALPVSSAIRRPSSSIWSLSSRPHSAISLPRSREAVFAQAFCALLAAATARSTSAAAPSAASAMTAPLAGLIAGKRRPDNDGRKAPSISNRFESSRANWCGSRLVDTRFASMALPFARSKAEFVQDGGAVAVEIGRRKPRRRVGEGRELHRIACETHGLARCNDRLDQHVARGHLRVCQGLRDVVDRPARNAGLAEDLDPGSGRLAAEDPVELAAQLGVVGVA